MTTHSDDTISTSSEDFSSVTESYHSSLDEQEENTVVSTPHNPEGSISQALSSPSSSLDVSSELGEQSPLEEASKSQIKERQDEEVEGNSDHEMQEEDDSKQSEEVAEKQEEKSSSEDSEQRKEVDTEAIDEESKQEVTQERTELDSSDQKGEDNDPLKDQHEQSRIDDRTDQVQQPSSIEIHYCEECNDTQEIATHYCTNCCMYLCRIQASAHMKSKKTKDHTCNELSSSNKSVEKHCGTHSSKKVSLVCITCDYQLICKDCALTEHKVHDYVFVHEIAGERKNELLGLARNVDGYVERILIETNHIESVLGSIMKKRDDSLSKIISDYEILKTSLEARMNELRIIIHEVTYPRLEQMENRLRVLNQLKNQLRSYTVEMISSCSDSMLIEEANAAALVVEELSKELSKPSILPDIDSFSITSNHEPVLNEITQWGSVDDVTISLNLSEASGSGLKHACEGRSAMFEVTLFSSKGEPYTGQGQLVVFIDVIETGVTIEPKVDRIREFDTCKYTVRYRPNQIGSIAISVTVDGHHIKDSPFLVTVSDSPLILELEQSVGRKGDKLGEFNHPNFVVVDSSGRFFVSDSSNNRIQIFTADGSLAYSFGDSGTENGQFDHPKGIAFDSFGNLAVCDDQNHRVQVFSPELDHLFSFGTKGVQKGQLQNPRDIAVDSEGNFLVVDSGNCRIQVFGSDGAFKSTFGSEGSDEGEFKYPYGISVGDDGRIYVTDRDSHCVQVFSKEGKFEHVIGECGRAKGKLSYPRGICIIDSADKHTQFIAVCDEDNQRIQLFDTLDYRFVCLFESSLIGGFPYAVAVSPDQQHLVVSVTDSENQHKVQWFHMQQ